MIAIHPTWLIILGGVAAYIGYDVAPKRRKGAVAAALGLGTAAALYSTGVFTARDPVPPMSGFPMVAQVRLP